MGPVVAEQLVTPVTPVMAHDPRADGETAPIGPVTVAVKTSVDPNDDDEELAVTATNGVAGDTTVCAPEVGAVAK